MTLQKINRLRIKRECVLVEIYRSQYVSLVRPRKYVSRYPTSLRTIHTRIIYIHVYNKFVLYVYTQGHNEAQ